MKNITVISLGGSIINPSGTPDVAYLKKFLWLLKAEIRRGRRFILVTGGGRFCRDYQGAARTLGTTSQERLDWLGIASTRFHAAFFQQVLGTLSHPDIVTDPTERVPWKRPVLLAGGYKPGRSTDYVAVALAKLYGVKTVVNLSNVDYLYTKDPKRFPSAKRVRQASWSELLKITGRTWTPGKNVPFDPAAAAFAARHKISVAVINGKNLHSLRALLRGKKFTGTQIG